MEGAAGETDVEDEYGGYADKEEEKGDDSGHDDGLEEEEGEELRVLGRAHFCWWVCGFSESVNSFGWLFGLLVRLGEENEEFFRQRNTRMVREILVLRLSLLGEALICASESANVRWGSELELSCFCRFNLNHFTIA